MIPSYQYSPFDCLACLQMMRRDNYQNFYDRITLVYSKIKASG